MRKWPNQIETLEDDEILNRKKIYIYIIDMINKYDMRACHRYIRYMKRTCAQMDGRRMCFVFKRGKRFLLPSRTVWTKTGLSPATTKPKPRSSRLITTLRECGLEWGALLLPIRTPLTDDEPYCDGGTHCSCGAPPWNPDQFGSFNLEPSKEAKTLNEIRPRYK